MKQILLASITTLLALPAFVACSGETNDGTKATDKSMTEQAKDAADAGMKELVKLKDQFSKATESTLSSLDGKIKELKDKAAAKGGDAKAEGEKLLAQINEKRGEVSKAFGELKDQSADTFKSWKSKVEEKLSELKTLVENALSKE